MQVMTAITCRLLSCIFLLLSWFSLFSIIGVATAGGTGDSVTAPRRSPSTKGQGSGGLAVINRYGSGSNTTKMLIHDKCRVEAIQKSFRTKNKQIYRTLLESGQGSKSVIKPAGTEAYIVTVSLGSGNEEFQLMLDTGSDTTWIRCKPNSGQWFDPSKSSTFSNRSCNPPDITYNKYYKDGSYSKGYYGCDTITFNSPGTSPKKYENFLFGCADDIHGDFSDAAGVLALGIGSSAANRFGSMFCICLPVRLDRQGYLFFGDEAQSKCKSTEKSLPLISGEEGHYYVNLIGILIGGKSLSVSSYSGSMPRTIIDTGTAVTWLPPSVYSGLRSEFQKSMSRYPKAASSDNPDTCYELTDEDYAGLTTPKMLLRFGGYEDITLSRETVLLRNDTNPQVFCLAFNKNRNENDKIIIGSYQLRGLNLLHDTQKMTLAYGKGGC